MISNLEAKNESHIQHRLPEGLAIENGRLFGRPKETGTFCVMVGDGTGGTIPVTIVITDTI